MNSNLKTILVTGGTGLVGQAIKSISKNYSYNFIFYLLKIVIYQIMIKLKIYFQK